MYIHDPQELEDFLHSIAEDPKLDLMNAPINSLKGIRLTFRVCWEVYMDASPNILDYLEKYNSDTISLAHIYLSEIGSFYSQEIISKINKRFYFDKISNNERLKTLNTLTDEELEFFEEMNEQFLEQDCCQDIVYKLSEKVMVAGNELGFVYPL